MEGPVLILDGALKRFGPGGVAAEITLQVAPGEFVGIIGRSGSGKSTTLRMINRLVEPSQGRILWNGEDITALRGRALRDWRRRCAMVFQHFNLVGRMDVLENVLLGRLAHTPGWRSLLKMWTASDRAIAMSALERLDIASLAAQRAGTLSGGQQQRVAICRALVQEPEIILADEPVASLDPRNAQVVMDALLNINRSAGMTVLVNLHSLDLARHYCTRLVGLAAGRVVFDGPPEALTEDAVRELYGMEADEVQSRAQDAEPVPAMASRLLAIA